MADNQAKVQGDENNPAVRLQGAVDLFQQGRLEEAREICTALIEADTRYFDALHLQGLIAYRMKSFDRAAELLDAALDIAPASALAHNNRALVFLELKQPELALTNLDKAITLRPVFAGAHNNRGNALRSLARFAEALAAYDTAISQRAAYAEAWYNRGLVLYDLKQYGDAVRSCRQAITLKPDYAEAHNTLGLALKEMRQTEAALENYDRAIALNPALAEAWNNRGIALQVLKRYDAALESCERAIALNAGDAHSWSNRGATLGHLQRFDEALQSYDKAIALMPDYANAWSNRGVTLIELGRRAEAIESYEKAIALDPSNADAHWNMSLCRLQLGDFEKGWTGHEWRWKAQTLVLAPRNFAQPLWLGHEPLAGKTILLHADQGLGDAIQFCRYASLLRDLGAEVILEVRKVLIPLLSGLDGVSRIIAFGDPLPAFDVQVPLGSLPAAFKTNASNIPKPTGYLKSSEDKRAMWQARLGTKISPRVGVVWSGNIQHRNDHNRSIPLADFVTMLPAGLDYICLQKDVRAEELGILQSRPNIRLVSDGLEDFSDTAALCDLLDIVVSVDTSVAHLAGAMGRAIWILLPFNPDWRWMLERTDSPWYATAKLYRQRRPGDWATVFDDVKADLLRLSTA